MISLQDIKKTINLMCDIIIEKEVEFCNLDSAAGDGDLGLSLSKGFRVVKKELDQFSDDSIGSFLRDCGATIAEHCGGASGPIWSSGFRGASKYAGEKIALSMSDLSLMLESAYNAIQKMGGAKLGDKTLLDALIPAVESLKQSGGEDPESAFRLASDAAMEGAEKTRNIVASRGRATYVGERSITFPDAGAMVVAILFKEIYNGLKRG